MYVTFLLRAEREYEIKNDQSWLMSLLKPEKSTMYVTFCRMPTVREKNKQCCHFLLCKPEKSAMYVAFLLRAE